MPFRKKLLIIGGVAGGASCAARARRLNEDADITVFEMGPYASFANCGLPYYVGQVIRDRENLIIATPEMFEEWFNIDIRVNCEVQLIDTKKRELKVKNLDTDKTYYENYDALLISSGATPKIPPIHGINLPGIFTLRNIPDTLSITSWIKERNANEAIILGGGFIGIEIAENLLNLGIKIHLIEALNHIMPSFDEEMSSMIENHAKKMGINFYMGNGVSKFELKKNGLGIKACLQSGEVIQSDIVIVATGIKPQNSLAVKAGIKTGYAGGIEVDEYMQTSDPHIWAVGDVIETENFISKEPTQITLAGPANRQGRIAAKAIMRGERKHSPSFYGFRGVQGTSVCGVLGMTVASTGLNEKQLKDIIKENNTYIYEKIHVHAYDHSTYYPGAKKITIKLIFSKKDGRIFGAQALGLGGVEKRIDIIAMAIQNKATVFDLAEAELCYAPQYGSAKDVINIAGMVAANLLDGYFEVAHWNDLETDKCVLLDVREEFIYKRNHVKGAINIPLEDLRTRLVELNKGNNILVYCLEGKRSYFACRILKQNGFNVKSMSGGYTMYLAYENKV